MDDLFWLSEAQMRRIQPYFPLSHGIARVDDRRAISGIVFVIRNGLRWRDTPREYGQHKTIYNRFARWRRLGVFNKVFAELARKAGKPSRLMIDATPRAQAVIYTKVAAFVAHIDGLKLLPNSAEVWGWLKGDDPGLKAKANLK